MGVAPTSNVQRAYVHPCVHVRAEYKFLSGRALVNIEQHPAAAGLRGEAHERTLLLFVHAGEVRTLANHQRH